MAVAHEIRLEVGGMRSSLEEHACAEKEDGGASLPCAEDCQLRELVLRRSRSGEFGFQDRDELPVVGDG